MDRRTFLQSSTALALTGALPLPALAADPVTLRVGYIPIIAMTQLFVMEGEGWTKSAGIDLKLTSFSSGPAMVQALASGSLDLAYVGIGPALLAKAKGIDLKVVAANVVDQVALIGRGKLAEMFPAAPSPREGFKRFREAAGHPAKLATLPSGSVPDTVLRYYLQEVAKVDPADVEIVGVGEDQIQQLLLAGAVDGASILEPILSVVLAREPSAKIIAAAGKMLAGQPGAVVVVTKDALSKYRPAVQKIVELHARAVDFVKTSPDQATNDLVNAIGKGLVDPAVMRKALTSDATQLIADPHSILATTGILQDFQVKIGSQPSKVELADLFDFSFFDALPAKR